MNPISSIRVVQPIYRSQPVRGYQYKGQGLSKAIKEGKINHRDTEYTE